jgi:hypothetical protein
MRTRFFLEGCSRYDLRRKRGRGFPRPDPIDPSLLVIPCCTRLKLRINRTRKCGYVDIFLVKKNEGKKARIAKKITQFHCLQPFVPSVAPYGTWLGGEDLRKCVLMFAGPHGPLPNCNIFELRIAGTLDGKSFYQKMRLRITREHARGATFPRVVHSACLSYYGGEQLLQGSWYPEVLSHLRHRAFARWQDKKLKTVDRVFET